MRFILSIELGNDAMQTAADVAEALRQAADRVADMPGETLQTGDKMPIRDLNGNRVGSWHVEGKE